MAESGFAVDTVDTSFGGQFLYAEGSSRSAAGTPAGPSEELLDACRSLSARVDASIARWQEFLDAARDQGERVLVWGAGSKGTTFLNVVPGAREVVPAIVDLNPRKHGRFVPGSGHEVISPEAAAALAPDVVVVMNPLYAAEVESLLREQRRGGAGRPGRRGDGHAGDGHRLAGRFYRIAVPVSGGFASSIMPGG